MRLDRIEREENVLVDVIRCQTNPSLVDTSFSCRTIDVSESGMQVESDLKLPPATVLGLRLEFAEALYRLEAEVRWSFENGKHYSGLVLDEDSADFVNWTRMFQIDFD